jgi:hypothetical protein
VDRYELPPPTIGAIAIALLLFLVLVLIAAIKGRLW